MRLRGKRTEWEKQQHDEGRGDACRGMCREADSGEEQTEAGLGREGGVHHGGGGRGRRASVRRLSRVVSPTQARQVHHSVQR